MKRLRSLELRANNHRPRVVNLRKISSQCQEKSLRNLSSQRSHKKMERTNLLQRISSILIPSSLQLPPVFLMTLRRKAILYMLRQIASKPKGTWNNALNQSRIVPFCSCSRTNKEQKKWISGAKGNPEWRKNSRKDLNFQLLSQTSNTQRNKNRNLTNFLKKRKRSFIQEALLLGIPVKRQILVCSYRD